MILVDILTCHQDHPTLKGLTLEGIVLFSRLASHLKRDILQPQPLVESNHEAAPTQLPSSILTFLATCIEIPLEDIAELWNILKDHIWNLSRAPLHAEDYLLFNW